MSDSSVDATALLRGAQLRVTRPRVAVLNVLAGAPHSDTDTVTTLARSSAGPMSKQAVYDVLHALTAAGLVRRFEPAGSVARYELRDGDHHHVVCRGCGAIADIDRAVGGTRCLTVPMTRGFTIDETEVIYWGQCPKCRPPGKGSAFPA